MINSFCPYCDTPFSSTPKQETSSLRVRGEEVFFSASVLRCPSCHSIVADSRVEENNILAAYDHYRELHDIIAPTEIHDLRNSYGLSVREFGKFLGFGEQTVTKYESGSLPDKLHANALKMAQTPEGALMLLKLNRNELSPASITRIERWIDCRQEASSLFLSMFETPSEAPSTFNGYRSFSQPRLVSLVWLLASKCRKLYKTKLQKAAFFCDTYACECLGKSITGASYAHANYGPVINNYEILLTAMERNGHIELQPEGCGEIIVPREKPSCEFSPEELDIVDRIVEFVDSFTTVNELSEYSHSLDAWKSTANGERIRYNSPFGQISNAIEGRVGTGESQPSLTPQTAGGTCPCR